VEPLFQAEGVSKVHNAGRPDELTALAGVSLAIRRGEALVLRGPSGSGKTTLLALLACVARPTAGRVFFAGREVSKLPERFLGAVRRASFGFIFQQFNLIPRMSALANVVVPLLPGALGPAATERRGRELLERFGLAGRAGTPVELLSGGEQQRVAVARALANDPEVVVADEPTSHLDRARAGELVELLGRLRREGRTLLVATHDPFVADHPFVTRVVELRDGRVAADRPR